MFSWPMARAGAHGDVQQPARRVHAQRVPHAAVHDHEAPSPDRDALQGRALFEQQFDVAFEQVHEFVGLGMHLPVRPVLGADVLGDQPAAPELLDLLGRQQPERIAAVAPFLPRSTYSALGSMGVSVIVLPSGQRARAPRRGSAAAADRSDLRRRRCLA